MKKLLFALLAIGISFSSFSQEIKYNLVFGTSQIKLTEEQKKEIDSLKESVGPNQLITIYPLVHESYYDRYMFVGTAKKQAAEIVTYAESIGFEHLGTPSNFPSGYNGLSVGVNLKLKPKPIVDNSLKKYFPEKPSQFFTIDPNKDTLIVGNEGTKLFFPSGCLLTKNDVVVELKEYYTMADYIKSDLPTVSNGEMIQSGGVIYLNAKEDNDSKKQVKINPEKGIGAEFTIGKGDTNMQIFIKDPKSKDELNWILPSKRTRDWQMTETVLDYDGSVVSQKTYYSEEEWKKHKQEQQEEKLNKIKKVAKETGQEESDLMLSINYFGFINCDKFYNEPVIDCQILAADRKDTKYYLVLTDIRGVLHGNVDGDEVSFGKIPKNKQAYIIAISLDDDQAYFYKVSFNTQDEFKETVELKSVSREFIDQQLASLK